MKLISGEKQYEVGPFDDFHADIWGLGCLMQYILTFNYPVQGRTLEDMMKFYLQPNFKIAELTNPMKYDDKHFQKL